MFTFLIGPPPPPGPPTGGFIIGAAGDYGTGGTPTSVANRMGSNGVNLVLGLGDLCYCGSSSGANSWANNEMRAIRNVFKPSRGNHDGSGGQDTTYPRIFAFPTSWLYHVRIGNALCITLDSDTRDAAIGGANYNHLVNRFQQFQNDPNVLWRFVHFHHPF
jgi:hypothetical protein